MQNFDQPKIIKKESVGKVEIPESQLAKISEILFDHFYTKIVMAAYSHGISELGGHYTVGRTSSFRDFGNLDVTFDNWLGVIIETHPDVNGIDDLAVSSFNTIQKLNAELNLKLLPLYSEAKRELKKAFYKTIPKNIYNDGNQQHD